MCLAIPGKVIKINGREAMVMYPDQERRAMIGEDSVKVGDFVMVQMGIIIKILSEEEAKVSMDAWKEK